MFAFWRTNSLAAALAVIVGLHAPSARAAAPDPYRSIVTMLASSLDDHSLVGIGEDHRDAVIHAFYRRLIGDPSFICRVDDIVVEFGNARFQQVADRYVAGGTVAPDEKRMIWRETGQWLVWDSPLYEQFFDTVRDLNVRKLCPKPVRVLLGDPPIDWSKVKTAGDYRAFAARDRHYAHVVEREVLAKGRKALLIVGGTHLQKAAPLEYKGSASLAQLIEQRHPGKLLSILPADELVAEKLQLLPAPTLILLKGTQPGRGSYSELASPRASMKVTVDGKDEWKPLNQLSWPAIYEVVNGFLYLGSRTTRVGPDPAIYRDPAYQAELRRRAVIMKGVYGFDFVPELEELIGGKREGK